MQAHPLLLHILIVLWVWHRSEMSTPFLRSEYLFLLQLQEETTFPTHGLNLGDMKTLQCLYENQEALPNSSATSGSNVGWRTAGSFLLWVSAPSFSLYQFPSCHMHMKSGALQESFIPSELKQSSEWEYSSGKNVPEIFQHALDYKNASNITGDKAP